MNHYFHPIAHAEQHGLRIKIITIDTTAAAERTTTNTIPNDCPRGVTMVGANVRLEKAGPIYTLQLEPTTLHPLRRM